MYTVTKEVGPAVWLFSWKMIGLDQGGSGEMLNMDVFWGQTKIYWRMMYQCERKIGLNDDSRLFDLSSWKYGGAIHGDGRTGLGFEHAGFQVPIIFPSGDVK